MSNIRKSFSFRDGIQVDNEILVVSGALVGIGTTIPTEKLEVRGTAKIAGLVTAQSLYVSGLSGFGSDVKVGNSVNIRASTGVITATAFYGNGATLSNLPTSQWVDVDVGLGFTSIYAQGNVGVGTTNPLSTFQIAGNPNASQRGVGINSNGDIRVSGVVTARSFVGFGSEITAIVGENITIGTISNSVFPIINNDRLPSNINVTGIVTAQSGFVGNVTGIASTARSLTGTPNITVGVVTSSQIISTGVSATNIIVSNGLVSAGVSVGILTVSQTLQVLSGTNELNFASGRLGIGTNAPTTDVQIRKNTNTTLEVLSNTGEARISIGQSVGIGNSNGVIRFGNSLNSFEILNRSIGAFNQYLHAGSATGFNTGGFNWIYGQGNTILATLSYTGNLGLGITNPTNKFHVVGTSTVTSDSFVGGNFSTPGSITFGSGVAKATLGSLTATPVLYNANLNTNVGLSTLNNLTATAVGIGTTFPKVGVDARSSIGVFNRIGIATNSILINNASLEVYGDAVFRSAVGLGTTAAKNDPDIDTGDLQIFDGSLKLYNGVILFDGLGAIGINTEEPAGAIDLSKADGGPGERTTFVPPVLTTTERNNLSVVPDGAIIFNTTTNTHQGFNGATWNDFY